MARPPKSNSKNSRNRIIEHAAFLFAQKGVNGTSVRDIAQRSQINVAMVSHYFGGKDGLYRACIDEMYNEIAGSQNVILEALASHEGSFEEKVQTIVSESYAFAREHRNAIRLVMRHVLDKGEIDPEKRSIFLLPFLEQATSIFATSEREEISIRLTLQSLIFLIVRYALSTDEELKMLVNGKEDTNVSITRHLTQIALLSLKQSQKEIR